jgi:prepilin-type N-terminal cleavage/methylation domain-containing protein
MRVAALAPVNQGFTLIEIVITTALMSVVLTSAYICLNAGITSRKAVEDRTEVLQSARVALSRISADLRAACPLSRKF